MKNKMLNIILKTYSGFSETCKNVKINTQMLILTFLHISKFTIRL